MGDRVEQLRRRGLIDFHFDLPMELVAKRDRARLFAQEFLPQLEAGGITLFVAALYVEDKYVPDQALEVALGQMEATTEAVLPSGKAAICRTFSEIEQARAAGKVAVIFGMEGAEPLGTDLNLLRRFHDAGLRLLGLTHARPNAAGYGGIFASSGSSPEGLTSFGRDLIRECEALGIIVDLAHINPAGFEDILSLSKQPPVVSHANARKFYDIERNLSDAQIQMIGERNGVIGVNSVLVSPRVEETTLDRYIDHLEHIVGLIGIEGAGIGFDFFEFLYAQWPEEAQRELASKLSKPHFIPDLKDHSHAPNLIRKLIERGFSDGDIDKILRGNWQRILRAVL
jgi:membrane dipeptidase